VILSHADPGDGMSWIAYGIFTAIPLLTVGILARMLAK
jgi:uncharacterized transporter YbjL